MVEKFSFFSNFQSYFLHVCRDYEKISALRNLEAMIFKARYTSLMICWKFIQTTTNTAGTVINVAILIPLEHMGLIFVYQRSV